MYNRESNIMRKLLGKVATDTHATDTSAAGASTPSTTILYRPTRSQSAVYSTGGVPIQSFDVSPDRQSVALAGPYIFKTIRLGEPAEDSGASTPNAFDFREGVDLRAAINGQPASGSRTNVVADQLSIRDVKWHGNTTLFTACANGRIFTYDLARIGTGGPAAPLDHIQIQEDSRQINTLDVNPHLKSWLLSGSQDGMARIFDVSAPWHNRAGYSTFRQRFAPLKCIDSIRQVKWSPAVGHEMACCTEAGVVLKWDVRQPSRPLLRINAHDKACSSIAWHPDGVHLISAGWDSKLHVWDFGHQADKRQKPKWTISTPAPVATVSWRPGLWSASAQGKRVAQVAVAYDENTSRRYCSSAVHIWDLARPTMPYRELNRFESSPTRLFWQDQDVLWTVGHDGIFNQCDVAFSARVLERQTMSTMDFSPRGDVVVYLDERPQPHRPRLTSMSYPPETIVRGSFGSSPNMPMLSVSKSDSEEDVGSFLGSSKRPVRKRRSTGRGMQSLSSTPPSVGSLDEQKSVLTLEQSLKISGHFRSQQAMATGHVPAAKSVALYEYLSQVYLETIANNLPCGSEGDYEPLHKRVGTILQDFARAAESVSQFRLAQTWRILAFAMDMLLKRRAQYHLEIRMARFQKMKVEDATRSERLRHGELFNSMHVHPGKDLTPRRSSAQLSIDGKLAPKSLLSEEIESTSNVPTPLARPADAGGRTDYEDHYYHGRKMLTPIVEPESLKLGVAAHGPFSESPSKRLGAEPLSLGSQQSDQQSDHSQVPSTEGYDFYDTEHLAEAIDISSHGQDPARGRHHRPRSDRIDSEESFGMFSASSGTKDSEPSSGSGDSWGASPRKGASDRPQPSQESAEEYHSRIRGEELDPSQSGNDMANHGGDRQWQQESPEEVFMISQTTAGTEDTDPSQSSDPSQQAKQQDTAHHSEPSPPTTAVHEQPSTRAKSLSLQFSPEPTIIDNDYLPWEDDASFPFPLSAEAPKGLRSPIPPLDPYAVVKRSLEFETRTSSLNASAMVLLLRPLTPPHVMDSHQASAILRQHHSRLMRMGLFVEASLLRKLCISGWPEGLPDWGDSYPAIFSPAQQEVKVGFFCSSCRKPREMEPDQDPTTAIWTCKRCKAVMAPCAVCGHRDPEVACLAPVDLSLGMTAAHDSSTDSDDSLASQWWYCPSCSHGGHASCLTLWHSAAAASLDYHATSSSSEATAYPFSPSSPSASSSPDCFSDGCCPLDGCGHACLPGRYRHQSSTSRSDELGRVASASVITEPTSASPSSSFRDYSNYASRRSSAANSRRSSPHRGGGIGIAGTNSGGGGGGSVASSLSVKSDGNEVIPSKAVGTAREALNAGLGGGNKGQGILSTSPGGRERRKSVKFAQASQ